jgi:putative addiction module component (TIGR02574 family)
MSLAIEELVDGALSLSTNERVTLVEKLLESLDAPNERINTIWSAESEDRISAYEDKRVGSKSAKDVFAKY